MNSVKKFIFPFILIVTFAACKNSSKDDSRNIQLLSDTTTYHNNTNIDSVKGNNSREEASNYRYHPKETEKATDNDKNHSGSSKNESTTSASQNSSATNQGNSSPATEKTTKKGWSKAAQGAVIGGATGAVGGAIISKHKGTGAAIGAAVGAASGYIIGKDRDKKDKDK